MLFGSDAGLSTYLSKTLGLCCLYVGPLTRSHSEICFGPMTSLCMCYSNDGDVQKTGGCDVSGRDQRTRAWRETVKHPEWPQHDVYRTTCAASGQLDVDSWNGFPDTGRWGTGLHAAVSR